MKAPTFEFIRSENGSLQWPKGWMQALTSTGRFFRSREGKMLFLVQDNPAEWVAVSRWQELKSILIDGSVLRITGDALDDNDWQAIGHITGDTRWRLPSASNRSSQAVQR
jgi:hypothetical protein